MAYSQKQNVQQLRENGTDPNTRPVALTGITNSQQQANN